jgi:hypothetical protein
MFPAKEEPLVTVGLGRCAEAPEKSPDAATACGTSTWIDVGGNELKKGSGWYDTRGMDLMQRFIFTLWGNIHSILSIIRARYLQAIPRIFTCIGTDQILLTDQALRSDFIYVRDKFWCRRRLRAEESDAAKLKRCNIGKFGMVGSWNDRKLPLLRLPIEHARSVVRSDLSWIRRVAVLRALFPAFLVRYLAGRQ